MRPCQNLWASLLLSVVCVPAAHACNGSAFSDPWNWGGDSAWASSGDSCDLEAQVWGVDASATASISYLRRQPSDPLRIRFTIDAPELPALNSIQGASFARGVARRVDVQSSGTTPVFNLALFGNLAASNYYVSLQGWCAGESSHGCSAFSAPMTLSDFPLDVELDAEVGAGSAGRLRLWLNSDPDTSAPSVQLTDLDNAATGGIDRVAVGVFSTTPAFNQVAAEVPIVLRSIESSDEQLFWSDFESLLAGNIETNRPPLALGNLNTYSGTTCGGSELLPQVAYGTTSLLGPVAIHPVTLGETLVSIGLDHAGPIPFMIFLCEKGAGPSGACVAAGSRDMPLYWTSLPPREYQLVVGALNSSCGEYTVALSGPLDD